MPYPEFCFLYKVTGKKKTQSEIPLFEIKELVKQALWALCLWWLCYSCSSTSQQHWSSLRLETCSSIVGKWVRLLRSSSEQVEKGQVMSAFQCMYWRHSHQSEMLTWKEESGLYSSETIPVPCVEVAVLCSLMHVCKCNFLIRECLCWPMVRHCRIKKQLLSKAVCAQWNHQFPRYNSGVQS